ncbi:RagB/SusD family nutrient uptake outer membrane protein [Sphingobacterium olei]|nr:RagB/SusD family nutrient uptake outer membrane protein [Sphingobacterium olei]
MIIASSSCDKFLDRPQLTGETDGTAWNSEENVRLYANQFYTNFFVGYGVNFDAQGGAALLSFTNSDDVLTFGNQANVTRAVPNSSIWSYTTVRSVNIMIDRVQKANSSVLSDEAKAHWLGIGRFFRAMRYSELVLQYADVPYYDREIFANELDELYKPRTPRNEIMDAVYDDLVYAYENVRLNDGLRTVNRYIVAGFITRLALYEASWQKYYYNNNERATKFFNLALDAGNFVISSGRYDIVLDYKSLFTSTDLGANGTRDALLYRAYDAAIGVTHSVASYSNLVETRAVGPTTDLIKAYICADGSPYQVSGLTDANKFDLTSLIKTRDSRFEATFYSKPEPLNRASLVYATKFLPRESEKRVKVDGLAPLPQFTSSNNDTDYPVLRYAEVLLNWIEAKAELATIGGEAVTQADIDKTINKIRSRPIHQEAADRGVQPTASLQLSNLPNDPNRDPGVSTLLWEIRRERRMEFTFEHSRLVDLRRWSKIDYLDTDNNLDLLSGGWVNFPTELPGELRPANVGILSVVKLDGTQTTYNGSNASMMMGFYRHTNTGGRLPFLNQINLNPYLQPVGLNQINDYETRGYELKQTEGWY